MRRLAVCIVLGTIVVGGVVLLAACGGGGSSSSTAVPSTSSSTTSSTTTTTLASSSTTSSTTTSTTALSSAEQVLPNGHIKALGYVKNVWVSAGTRKLSIDYVQLLWGTAAIKAAIADGVLKPGQNLDNDYYIRNQSPALRTFDVSGSVQIVISVDGVNQTITWATFLGYWTGSSQKDKVGRNAPYWIEREGSTIVSINQQFLP